MKTCAICSMAPVKREADEACCQLVCSECGQATPAVGCDEMAAELWNALQRGLEAWIEVHIPDEQSGAEKLN